MPRHIDFQIGAYRTDAPTTSWVALRTAVAIAMSPHMGGETLDMCAPFFFLSGL